MLTAVLQLLCLLRLTMALDRLLCGMSRCCSIPNRKNQKSFHTILHCSKLIKMSMQTHHWTTTPWCNNLSSRIDDHPPVWVKLGVLVTQSNCFYPNFFADRIRSQIQLTPRDYRVNSTLQLDCLVQSLITGEPVAPNQMTVVWYVNSDIPLAVHAQNQHKYRTLSNHTLVVYDLAKVDSGEYRCRATTGPTSDTMSTIHVQVDGMSWFVQVRRLTKANYFQISMYQSTARTVENLPVAIWLLPWNCVVTLLMPDTVAELASFQARSHWTKWH